MKNIFSFLIIFTTINFINNGPEDTKQKSPQEFSNCINNNFQKLFTISENLAVIYVDKESFNLDDFFSREDACKMMVEQITNNLTLNQIENLNKIRMQILQMWHKAATDDNNTPKEFCNAYLFLNTHLHNALCLAYDIVENKTAPKTNSFSR